MLHEFAKLGIPLVAALPGGLPDLLTHGIGDACVTTQSSGDRRGMNAKLAGDIAKGGAGFVIHATVAYIPRVISFCEDPAGPVDSDNPQIA